MKQFCVAPISSVEHHHVSVKQDCVNIVSSAAQVVKVDGLLFSPHKIYSIINIVG